MSQILKLLVALMIVGVRTPNILFCWVSEKHNLTPSGQDNAMQIFYVIDDRETVFEDEIIFSIELR